MTRTRVDTREIAHDDAVAVAECLKNDFKALISILERQGMNGSPHRASARANISDARAAAERGLRLSDELLELLRKQS